MGAALCLLSAACFGAMAVFGKLAYAEGVSPDALVLVRFALAAVLLAVLLVVRPGLRAMPTGTRTPRGRAAIGVLATAFALGAVGYATQASLYFAALERMGASLLSLIFYSYPLLVTLGAVLLGRDRLTAGRCAALAAASGGLVLVLAGAGGLDVDPVGAALGFGTALAYTVYILVADGVVGRLPPVLLAALVMTGAAVTLTVRGLVTGGIDLGFGPAAWFWLACIAVVSTVVAMLAFFAGLRRVGPSSAAILSTFEPVVTTALATLALGEFLTPVQVLGGLLVLSCVAIVQGLRPAGRDPAAADHRCAARDHVAVSRR
ncbi:DMT family transporter [Pseudonocardia lacus]|uniref:DMT family transporter n=1 Tax=Pseudonocardia lacus TaxID=2835865 RepID=UPI001BDC383C|nr:DMT family transporter [Pseudonocardia lacus]